MESERAIKVLIQVLGALEEAHSVGVIHRDLKPENILLTEQGGMADFPKVLDFGLAKVHETKPRPGSMVLTQEGMIFGTPEFMSPEQARGEILDARSDIYSVSLIFYELVTGMLPFPQCKPMEYISHHINTKPIAITERDPKLGLPKALDPIIARALEKDRDKRYQSAREFADALRAILPSSGKTVSARALPQAETEPISTRRTVPSVPAKKTPRAAEPVSSASMGTGKGVLLGLIAVIIVLLGLIAWLLVTRNQADVATVPTSSGAANAASPASGLPVRPQPGTPGGGPPPGQ